MKYFPVMLAMAFIPVGCMPPSGYEGVRRQPGNISLPVSKKAPQKPKLKHKKGRYRVTEPWIVDIGGEKWMVPKGYASNGITGPANVRASLGDGVDRPETWAAVFHDWLFKQPGMTRSKADKLFYELLIAYGVPPMKARLMYTSVSAYSATKAIR